MEELDLENILDGDQLESLYPKDVPEEPGNEGDGGEKETENKKDTEPAEVPDPDKLFGGEEPESVGGEERKDKGDAGPGKGDGSSNFYSSFASTLKDEGIFPDLDDDVLKSIKTAEDLKEMIEDAIREQMDERTRRVDEALSNGVEVPVVKRLENTVQYLGNITEEMLSKEDEQGEKLRRMLIQEDLVNRGYRKERIEKELKRSFDSGDDIEDAKEALESLKAFYEDSYKKTLEEAKRNRQKEEDDKKREASELEKSIMEDEKVFGEVKVDKATRRKVYDILTKPISRDKETGMMYTELQKYNREHPIDFMKNVALMYALTDGFRNLDKLVKDKVRREVGKGFKELERTLNNSTTNADGSLRLATGVSEDPESYIGNGWKLDV